MAKLKIITHQSKVKWIEIYLGIGKRKDDTGTIGPVGITAALSCIAAI